MWSSDCPVANPVILNLTPKMTKKETRRHWKKKVCDKNQLTAEMKKWIVKESNICIFADVWQPFLLMCFFVLSVQLSQSHDPGTKSWEFFLGVLKHGAG